MRIGILGYGNLGKGIECAIRQNEDMEQTPERHIGCRERDRADVRPYSILHRHT